jgi:dTDP-4-dehydrorhamnose 3,5-epimerase
MNFIKTNIDGVVIIEPKIFKDERGYFFESYNEQEFSKNGIPTHFVQDNQSMSTYGVVRGLHCQLGNKSQAKLVRVLHGKVLDVAVDVRPDSPTFGKHVEVVLSDENQRQLFIPRGFLHGFSVLSEKAVFAYKCDNFYCKEAEFGIRYDDPEIGINWRIPYGKIITSDKDRIANRLRDLKERNRE